MTPWGDAINWCLLLVPFADGGAMKKIHVGLMSWLTSITSCAILCYRMLVPFSGTM